MNKTRWVLLLPLLLCGAPAAADDQLIGWRSFNDDIFAEAASSKKLILLDLEAVWCHWCHVMDETTYRDPSVVELIKKHFLPIRVDQDARPDLSARYQDYGWPATIVLNGKAEDLAKRAGYIEPEEMRRLLEKLVRDPVPEEQEQPANDAPPRDAVLSADLREELLRRYRATFDTKLGGLKTSHKFLDSDTAELGLVLAEAGSSDDAKRVNLTLASNRKLIDPVWGGVYQYSVGGVWDEPHFEKIIPFQATNIRIYAAAYKMFEDTSLLQTANDVRRYVRDMLSDSDGAIFTSQDADVVRGKHSAEYFTLSDKARRAHGMPAIDKNRYARENGLMIQALCDLYAATGDSMVIEEAKRAASWVRTNRRLPSGGYAHGDADQGGPFLADSLAMARALLALYTVTAERDWLAAAEEPARFVIKTFFDSKGSPGFYASPPETAAKIRPPRLTEHNIEAARMFNLLHRYTGAPDYRAAAERAMRFLGQKSVALASITEPGILLADRELNNEPLHFTIVARKSDAAGAALFLGALRYPRIYKRSEWFDRSEGPLPNPDVQYPTLPKAAAFICTNKRCSVPIFDAAKIPAVVKSLQPPSGGKKG